MDSKNLIPDQLVHKLSMAGRHPHPDFINVIWEQRSETTPLLLSLFEVSKAIYKIVHISKWSFHYAQT